MKATKLLSVIFALLLTIGLCACTEQNTPETTAAPQTAAGPETTDAPDAPLDMDRVVSEIDSKKVEDFIPSQTPTDYVKLSLKDFGEIVVRLRPDAAPLSVQNFKDLVARGYYDGTSFHRVMPGFMIQGGAGTERLTPIRGEFAANGVNNPLRHVRGVLSMARTSEPDSATSQFFLMHADYHSLDGQYAAFGYIVAGLETVDKVCQVPLSPNPYRLTELSVPQVEVLLQQAQFVTPKG